MSPFIFDQVSGFLFFERGLNAAAGSKGVEPPFGWPRLPATTESLTMSKFNRLFTLRPLLQIEQEMEWYKFIAAKSLDGL
jgi:hypothetical protein